MVAYLSPKNRDQDSILGIPATERAHSASLWHSSPISISFLGLSKLITRSAFCTSISSSLRTGTVFLSTLSDAIHQTDNRDKSFLHTHFKPSKGQPGLRILLQIIQFTSNKLAVKFWTCPSATDIAAERTAPISNCEWKQISDAWSLMNKIILIYSPLAQLSQCA